jgi:hypothetical protein
MTRNKDKTALVLGRFQPPTIAHVAFVETILRSYETLLIGILMDTSHIETCDIRWSKYVEATHSQFTPKKNPFLPDEIKQMWDAYLKQRNLIEVVKCVVSKRVPFEPNFNRLYPVAKYDMVVPTSDESDPVDEGLRNNLLPRLLGRVVVRLSTPFKLHNSRIRSIVKAGGADWNHFVPKEALDVFQQLDGNSRMAASEG